MNTLFSWTERGKCKKLILSFSLEPFTTLVQVTRLLSMGLELFIPSRPLVSTRAIVVSVYLFLSGEAQADATEAVPSKFRNARELASHTQIPFIQAERIPQIYNTLEGLRT
ncbi:unnamed protein product [Leptosia nina]|uniref:Uncharacterized protein n=1 Tax=Leptosia nina TaxID=320188 RepID=A0AAV1JWX4_9NEOP